MHCVRLFTVIVTMRTLRACLKKDIRLFFGNRAGVVLAILLPVVMLAALWYGGRETMNASASVRPFAVAVRDEDDTFMSDALISQLQTISLFSEVLDADAASDEQLFQRGAAAVITIPRDFFYDAFDGMAEIPLSLNGNMPVESMLVSSFSSALLDLVTANQTAAQVRNMLSDAPLTDQQVKEEAARGIFRDAFSLLDGLHAETLISSAYDASSLMISSCVLSLICLLVPLQIAFTLTDDRTTGLLPRFLAADGSITVLVLSKFLVMLLMTVAPVSVLILLLCRTWFWGALLICILSAAATFFLCAAAALALDANRPILLYANLYILLSLLLGGVIYPIGLFPKTLSFLRFGMLPYYVLSGLRSLQTLGRLSFSAVWPLIACCGLCLTALSALRMRKKP